jgi:Fe-S-cluster containining protein
MEENEKKEEQYGVQPVQLTGKSRFCFNCGPEVACFTKCCHGMEIILAPYDILRLKRRLGLTSPEFLLKYTSPKQHEESSLPLVLLKMGDDGENTCPFLTGEGCSVYEDRPSICRYYPIGLATLRTKPDPEKEAGEERFFFMIKEEHCLGHKEKREWTIDEWRRDQGADSDDEINRDWQAAFLSRAIPGEEREEVQRQSIFYMTCYDLDTFRRFVLESPFLEKFEVDPETVEKVRENDEELLGFALRYMKYFMMMEETMTPKEGVVDSWRQKKAEENN